MCVSLTLQVGVTWVKEALGLSNPTSITAGGDGGTSNAHLLAVLVANELGEYEAAAHPSYAAAGIDPTELGFHKVW